jgi:endonuclease III
VPSTTTPRYAGLSFCAIVLLMKERQVRARKILAYLKRAYPVPKTELQYRTPFQLLASVMLSAQTTDKQVNKVTKALWKNYKTVNDFASADYKTFDKEISSISFHRNKAKAIIASAKMVRDTFKGKIPTTEAELVQLPGVAYKTAHVVLGELYDIWEGIPTDTHVKRFAHRFDLTKETDLKKISKDLEALLPKKDWKYINNGLVLYGRYVCNARPHDCAPHPLTRLYPKAAKIWPKTK